MDVVFWNTDPVVVKALVNMLEEAGLPRGAFVGVRVEDEGNLSLWLQVEKDGLYGDIILPFTCLSPKVISLAYNGRLKALGLPC